ncbi:MAG: hydrogenase maturation nickel metallochaperone HypA [Planctomycetota bacterium]
MHELSIAQSLRDTALAAAGECSARRISVIRLRIGGLRQIVEESLREAFAILAEGSIAEGATIQIDWVPSLWRCARCGRAGGADEGSTCPPPPAAGWGMSPGAACPCGGREWTFEGSDDLVLTSLDVECGNED